MIEIRITKEIGNYEAKFLGPFTLRQVICIGIGAPVCFLIYKTLSPIMTTDLAGFFCAIPGAIAALFGWVRPYGMKTEKFIQSIFVNMVLAPSHRIYKSKNYHESALEMIEEAYVTEKEEAADVKKATPTKKKYKLSEKAYK